MIPQWLRFRNGHSEDDGSTAEDDSDESSLSVEYVPDGLDLEEPPATHQTIIGPETLERTSSAIRTGNRWARTLWVGEFPDAPMDGLFETLYASPETRSTDIAIHLEPKDTYRTLDALENRIESLEADVEYLTDKRRAGARGLAKDLEDYRDLYDTLRNTPMRAFDVAMYLTVRSAERETLNTEAVATMARRAPANLTPVTPRWNQLDALVSASPVAVDRLRS